MSRSQPAYDLADLVRLGLVERLGSGRATRYRIRRPAVEKRRRLAQAAAASLLVVSGLAALTAIVLGRMDRAPERLRAERVIVSAAASVPARVDAHEEVAEIGERSWREGEDAPAPRRRPSKRETQPAREAVLVRTRPAEPVGEPPPAAQASARPTATRPARSPDSPPALAVEAEADLGRERMLAVRIVFELPSWDLTEKD